MDPFLQVPGRGRDRLHDLRPGGPGGRAWARVYPRFGAENLTQVAGSYGGIAFMVLAVLFILVEIALLAWPSSIYLWHQYRGMPIPPAPDRTDGCRCCRAAVSVAVTFWTAMQRGIRALEALGA